MGPVSPRRGRRSIVSRLLVCGRLRCNGGRPGASLPEPGRTGRERRRGHRRRQRGAGLISDERRAKVEELFMRHAKGVAGYVLARVGDAEVAEVVTSSVFEIVVRRIDQCRGSPAAWLWSIVR